MGKERKKKFQPELQMNVLHKSYEHETHTHIRMNENGRSKKEIREHFTVLALYIFMYA